MKRSSIMRLGFRSSGGRAALVPLVTMALAGLLVGPSAPGEAAQSPAGARRAADIERELGSGIEVRLSAETGLVRFLGTAPGQPVKRPPDLGAGAGAESAPRPQVKVRLGLEPGSSSIHGSARGQQ
jgi:hypothetical protein